MRTCLVAIALVWGTLAHASYYPIANPFIYEIKTRAGTLYLLGTYHYGVDLEDLPSSVQALIPSLKSVTLEVLSQDPVHFFDLDVQQVDFNQFQRTSLRSELSQTEYAQMVRRIETAWNLRSVNPDYMYFLSPIAASFIYRNAWMVENRQAKSLDQQIEGVAAAAGVQLQKLETPSQTYAALAPFWRDGLRDLKDTLADPIAVNESLSLYRSGDEEKLASSIADYIKTYPDLGRATFNSRTRNWQPQILELLQRSGKNMLAVGAGHLFGPEGIIEMIKLQGFKPNRIQGE